MILTDNLIFDIIAITTTILLGFIAYLKWNLNYWKNQGIPTSNPGLLFGDTKKFLTGRASFGEEIKELYEEFKHQGHKHGGVYLGPRKFYLPVDPEIIKNIMQTDFSHFMNHGGFFDEKADPLSANLFNLEDAKWRDMRVKLTPTFTSGKMKMMFQTLASCAVGLDEVMEESAEKHIPLDIKDILGRFTTDIISSAAFGLETNSLRNPDSEFRKYGKKFFETDFIQKIKILIFFVTPHSILHAIRFSLTPGDVEKFFMNAVHQTVDYREKNNIYRKDFMHLLLQLKNRGVVKDDSKITDDTGKLQEKALTMNELAAQAFVFFLAGFETSSTLMTWTLYELALNQDVQNKLRNEIEQVLAKHQGQISYEAIQEMTYMDNVLNEGLRKYPPVPVLTRKCNKEYNIPKSPYKIEKGIDIAIPVLALHKDPEFYPNPEKFDPDRFTPEEKQKRPGFTWIPFGEGPRLCIGLRFGLMQSKVGLTTLLRNYRINLSQKTKLPIKFDPHSFVTSALNGIYLDIEKLE